jgi:hypothetical protein
VFSNTSSFIQTIRLNNILFIVISFFLITSCKKNNPTSNKAKFESIPVQTSISPGLIDEVSGIADSRLNKGALWIEEDGGKPAQLQLLLYNGNLLKKIQIKNADNRDWEDLAIGVGPMNNTSYLYIADIGDNNVQNPNYNIYRFPEPAASVDTVFAWDKINFSYPDGAHDAGALLIDNETKDIYIVTKTTSFAKLYKLRYPQSTINSTTAILVNTLSLSNVVSAALSSNGQEIILKTYTGLYYWQRTKGQTIESALQKQPLSLGYQLEPQGEAVCFKNDGSGFFTLSEKSMASSVSLNLYKLL